MGAWTTLENALRTWVKTGSGFADDKVIWADQDAPQPSGNYITLRIGDVSPVGPDELRTYTHADADPGEEIELQAIGMREFVVSVQAFGTPTSGDGTARETLLNVLGALRLPSVRNALVAADLTPYQAGPVQNLSTLVQTKFESRAALEVWFYTSSAISEFTGYIESVEITDFSDLSA